MGWCEKHTYAYAGAKCPDCKRDEPNCGGQLLKDSTARLFIKDLLEVRPMNQPTQEQLNDPTWWDRNIGQAISAVVIERDARGGVVEIHKCLSATTIIAASNPDNDLDMYQRPIKPKAERLSQHLAERDALLAEDVEPLPEQESIAGRIMGLGNQVHNIGCEVQHDEALAGELEDIRGRLWELGRKVCKTQERSVMIDRALEACGYDPSEFQGTDRPKRGLHDAWDAINDLYDAGLLRKAGEK